MRHHEDDGSLLCAVWILNPGVDVPSGKRDIDPFVLQRRVRECRTRGERAGREIWVLYREPTTTPAISLLCRGRHQNGGAHGDRNTCLVHARLE